METPNHFFVFFNKAFNINLEIKKKNHFIEDNIFILLYFFQLISFYQIK